VRHAWEIHAKAPANALLLIPRFGKKYVVPVIEGVDPDDLAAGVGHFPGTAGPGAVGNFALAGHRVTHGEPFRDMPSLRKGDKVIVETRHTTYTYVLDTGGADLTVPFTSIWVIAPIPLNPDPNGIGPAIDKSRRLLTLTTCSELFHTDNRLIAFGHLLGKTSTGQ
jgi:sortase A